MGRLNFWGPQMNFLEKKLKSKTRKTALITGITGQDGSYLAELLVEKGYEVHGLVRRTSSYRFDRIENLLSGKHFEGKVTLHEGDLGDGSSLQRAIRDSSPDEVYNLAAMSDVKVSFDVPEYSAEVDGIGTLRMLEAMRFFAPNAKLYQASTSELYGKVQEVPQTEKTPFYPRSPYAVAKLYSYWAVINYREAYGMHVSNGILFNHESPRRGEGFVSRKITLGVARIHTGLQKKLVLGNLDAKRDWGYAKDFVEGMWRILQQEKPDDYVLATGVTTTVRSFVELAFKEIGVEISWQGRGVQEKGFDKKTGDLVVEVSPDFFRPTEVDLLIGSPQKAKEILGWEPKTKLAELVQIMVRSDLKQVEAEKSLQLALN